MSLNNIRIAVSYFERLRTFPNKNFKGICDSLLCVPCEATVISYTPQELLDTSDYDAVFLLRGGQAMSDKHISHYQKNNILITVWHDDIFCWNKFSPHLDDIYVWRVKRFACHSKKLMGWFDVADVIFLPYVNAFLKFKRYNKYRNKVVWMPWSAHDSLLEMKVPWTMRKDRILLSGHMHPQYAMRHIIHKYSLTNTGKNVIDSIKHYGYTEDVQDKMLTGQEYYDHLMTYKGAIATSAVQASDFHRAKYMEIAACGCLPFFEYTPDIHFLGFIDGINCIVIDNNNYQDKFQMMYSEKAPIIAQNARELIKERHLHSHRAKNILSNIISKLELR